MILPLVILPRPLATPSILEGEFLHLLEGEFLHLLEGEFLHLLEGEFCISD